MITPAPAAARNRYIAAGAMIGTSILICLACDLGLWLGALVWLLTLGGALVGVRGALLHDRADMDTQGRDNPEPDEWRRYVFTGRRS